MAVVSIVGLLVPALDESGLGEVAVGFALGVAFMLGTRRMLGARQLKVLGRQGKGVRSSALVFLVLLAHSFPEGLAIGTAYASDTAGLGLFVIVAIALQNIPEGTSVAIPMQSAGFSRVQQFWAAVVTSAPQPIAAVAAFGLVEHVGSLLPLSFAFAAAAMLLLVVVELLPDALAGPRLAAGLAGTLVGAGLMIAFSAALGV
jgi:ZIP family zinc transporter